MPSAVAYTDMCQPWSTKPGPARQERWCVQLPEYLFDVFLVRPRDGGQHTFEWGFHNLGEAAVVQPANVDLQPATNPDGTPWDPVGYYRKNTGHEGREFNTDEAWKVDWTLNEGNIRVFDEDYPYPPRSARVRLTMASEPRTKVVLAWLRAPGRNNSVNLRQDFVVAHREGRVAAFVDTIEPIGVGDEPFVQGVELVDGSADDALAVKVETHDGNDWFLVGGSFDDSSEARHVGPFRTDAALAVLRVDDGGARRGMIAGGTQIEFVSGPVRFSLQRATHGTCHFDGTGKKVPGNPPRFELALPSAPSAEGRQSTDTARNGERASPGTASKPDAKPAVPSTAAQQEARKRVSEKIDLHKPPSSAQRLMRARKLLEVGAESQWNSEERFVVLRRAMELAAEGGDAELMVEVLDAIDERFEVDILPVKCKMLAAFAEEAKNEAAIQSLVAATCPVADQAVEAGRLELGMNLLRKVYGACKRPEGADYVQPIYDRGVKIRRLQQQNR